MRLNKYLSDAGVCSRRQADKLIEEKRILVNGKLATIGQQINETDGVFVDNKRIRVEEEKVVLAFNKPVGVECTTNPLVKDNIIEYIGYNKRIFPIGRLDKNSSGLILLTNDGSIVNEIMRAANMHEKEYIVTVNKAINDEFLYKMSKGVEIPQFDKDKKIFKVITRQCTIKKISSNSFSIILTQGYNRQIRRMCHTLGYEVTTLKRIRIMDILLGDLKEGQIKRIDGQFRKN